jgi:hypothetical protein
MERSTSWEANSPSTGQKIPRILWNPKFRYPIHNSSPPVTIHRQINPVHIPSYILFLEDGFLFMFYLLLGLPRFVLTSGVPAYASAPSYTCDMPYIDKYTFI